GDLNMRVSVTVLDDQGKAYGGEANLQVVDVSSVVMPASGDGQIGFSTLDFNLPVRPFMKKYGSEMSGPKRFTLLLAHCARGAEGVPSNLEELARLWNSMKGMGGTFNSAYPTRAKDNGWVDSTKTGVYVRLPGWTEILGD